MYPFLKLLMVVDDQFKIKVTVENFDTTLILIRVEKITQHLMDCNLFASSGNNKKFTQTY